MQAFRLPMQTPSKSGLRFAKDGSGGTARSFSCIRRSEYCQRLYHVQLSGCDTLTNEKTCKACTLVYCGHVPSIPELSVQVHSCHMVHRDRHGLPSFHNPNSIVAIPARCSKLPGCSENPDTGGTDAPISQHPQPVCNAARADQGTHTGDDSITFSTLPCCA